jgi:hypothetical protein
MTRGERQADLAASLRAEARDLRRRADRIADRAREHDRARRKDAADWCRHLATTLRRFSRWTLSSLDPMATSGRCRSAAVVDDVLARLEDALHASENECAHDALLALLKAKPDALADEAERRMERAR